MYYLCIYVQVWRRCKNCTLYWAKQTMASEFWSSNSVGETTAGFWALAVLATAVVGHILFHCTS